MKNRHIKFTSYIGQLPVVVKANYVPGDPGVHTFANGDPGYPPTDPELEITSVTVDFDALPENDKERLRIDAQEQVDNEDYIEQNRKSWEIASPNDD